MMHYSDERDNGTLECQITILTQRGNSAQQFCQEVCQYLSLSQSHNSFNQTRPFNQQSARSNRAQ